MIFRRQAIAAAFFAVCVAGNFAAQDVVHTSDAKSANGPIPYKKCWEYSLQNSNGGTLVSSNGTVYFAEPGGRVRALASKTGQVNWVTELGGNIVATLIVPKFGVAVVSIKPSTGTHELRMLNFETGLVKYSVSVAASGEIYLLTNGEKIVIAETSGSVFALDPTNGSTAWNMKVPGALTTSPALSPEMFVSATKANKIEIFSMKDGRPLGTIDAEKQVTALAIRENEMIVAGDERGGVTTYRNNAGDVWWRFKSGARIGTVVSTPEGVLVGSFDNFVYFLSNYSGDVKWKRRLNGRIVSQPLVVNNLAFIASSTEEFAIAIDLMNGRPTDQLPFGENQFLITKPVFTNHDTVVFGLTGALAGFSQGQCSQN